MKKDLFACSIVLCAVLFSAANVMSGKPFEGVITYKITYPESKISESQMAMFPKQMTISVKGSKSRQDMQMGGVNSIEITDYIAKSKVNLINFGGQKFAIKKTNADIEKEMEKVAKPTVELSPETKMIAGYTCKKAIVTVNDDGEKSTLEVWYSNELGSSASNFDNPFYKDIDGVMLEFLIKDRGISMKFTATSIEKKSLPAKDFEIPTDYTLTTQEELKSKFGGGND